jgi:hypothetical protein
MAGNYSTNINKCLLNGIDLATLGARVEKSTGFLDMPARKEFLEMNWPDKHGLSADLAEFKMSARNLNISLYVFATTLLNLKYNIDKVYNELMKPGHQYLKMGGLEAINLVYLKDEIKVSRYTKNNSLNSYALLDISLVDPCPKTLQYYTNQSTLKQVSLNILCSKPITIDWGNKTYSYLAQSGNVSKNYEEPGNYAIVIYGEVDAIATVSPTNAIAIQEFEFKSMWDANTILTDNMIMDDDIIIQ